LEKNKCLINAAFLFWQAGEKCLMNRVVIWPFRGWTDTKKDKLATGVHPERRGIIKIAFKAD